MLGRNYIGGEFKEERSDFASLNPCTEMEIGFFPLTDKPEVDEAVDAAKAAFPRWSKLSRVKRAEFFDNLAQLVKRDQEKLARTISLETGKSLNESRAEVIESLHMCQVAAGAGRTPYGEYYASEISEKDAYVVRKPKGVVAVVAPWNFPLAIGSFWSSAPALVEGNCVVHKPSEMTPLVAQLACELYHEAGFPAGVYNMIHGMDYTGKALVENNIDCVLFTGSAQVGMLIRLHCAGTWHKTCSCEMGSKSAVIVCKDGNPNLALDACAASAMKLSGQRCVSASRILVQRELVEQFAPKLVDKIASLTMGNPFDEPAPYYGPVINSDAVKKIEHYNDLVREDREAKVLLNGSRQGNPGYFISPFVYQSEWRDVPFLKEEVFGPHVAIIPFDKIEDAIDIYNDTEYGLALGVITDDFRTMRKMRDECRAGMLYLNGGSIAAESHLPFGGVGKSGNGYKSAAGTYKAVTEEIAVTTNYEPQIKWAQGMK